VGRKKIDKIRDELNKEKSSDIYETKSRPTSKKVEVDIFAEEVWIRKKRKKGKEQGKGGQEAKKRRYLK
jgi:hypothetical protein